VPPLVGLSVSLVVGTSPDVSLGSRGHPWVRFHSPSTLLIAAVLFTSVIGAPLSAMLCTSSSHHSSFGMSGHVNPPGTYTSRPSGSVVTLSLLHST